MGLSSGGRCDWLGGRRSGLPVHGGGAVGRENHSTAGIGTDARKLGTRESSRCPADRRHPGKSGDGVNRNVRTGHRRPSRLEADQSCLQPSRLEPDQSSLLAGNGWSACKAMHGRCRRQSPLHFDRTPRFVHGSIKRPLGSCRVQAAHAPARRQCELELRRLHKEHERI